MQRACHCCSVVICWVKAILTENCDVSRIEQEMFCQLAETGHMLQSDVQELEKQEQGNFVYSIKELAHTLKSSSMALIIC